MPVVRPPDEPPLLPAGFHPFTVDDVERFCVATFPSSSTRRPIMDGFQTFCTKLVAANVPGELWLDGSFFTKEINPKDIDIVLRMKAEDYDGGDQVVRQAVDWVIANQKSSLRCDSYAIFEYPQEHALHAEGKVWYSFYHSRWSVSREFEVKGVAVITLSGIAP